MYYMEQSRKLQLKLKPQPQLGIEIKNMDGLSYLQTIDDNSIDLILTDPPYIISHDTGMDTFHQEVTRNEALGIEYVKTEEDWRQYKDENKILDDTNKEKYLKYGSVYGKKYSVMTNYGPWDESFTIQQLDAFVEEFYKKLRKGGAMIIFFDIWKITILKEIMDRRGFKQIRFIEWIKTNPQPLNSRVNYLTNCREIALMGIKGSVPTFNSSYDNGIYQYPLQGGKNRFHPTQKSLELFKELIKKHSNVGDTVLDPFLGGGTTALAALQMGRKFKGCEISKEYYDRVVSVIEQERENVMKN